jgi:hypothetical protein
MISPQMTAALASARNNTESPVTRLEYTVVKTILTTLMSGPALTEAVRELSRVEGRPPLIWFYEQYPSFKYDMVVIGKESRLIDVLYNTTKTAPWKMFKERREEVGQTAVIFKPTDYASYTVLHNYTEIMNLVLSDNDWRVELNCNKKNCVVQPLTSFLVLHGTLIPG